MRQLGSVLDSVVAKTKFDLGKVEHNRNGVSTIYSGNPSEIISPNELRGRAVRQNWDDEISARARKAKTIVADDVLERWLAALGEYLGKYIDTKTRKIGHAFPMESSVHGYSSMGADGVMSQGFISTVNGFAKTLVRGSAIMGTDRLVEMLSRWVEENSVNYRTCAVVNGLYLHDSLEPLPGIRIEPLPRSTDGAFGSLPVLSGSSIENFLGRTVLKIDSVAQPAFYRPEEGNQSAVVQARIVSQIEMDSVRMALALEANTANTDVGLAFEWNDYEEASLYLSPGSRGYHSRGRRGGTDSRGTGFSLRTDYASKVTTLMIDEENISHPSETRIGDIVRSIPERKKDKITVAISRWCKSRESFRMLADQFIDLRIALEALYLKDFTGEQSQEMRFRLALFGAWHLGEDFEGRKEIRKTLRRTYDVASAAVHGGDLEFSEDNRSLLAESQNLCRQGILKLLEEGTPNDWGEMILG